MSFTRFAPLVSWSINYPGQFIRLFSSEARLRIVTASAVREVSVQRFKLFHQHFDFAHYDLGTGDAKYIYRLARENPNHLFVGIDSNDGPLFHPAWKKKRKVPRGGLPRDNLQLVHSSIQSLPDSLTNVANRISINFPWGSLLNDLTSGCESIIEKVATLAKPEAEFSVLLNASIYHDPSYVDRLQVANMLEPAQQEKLRRVLIRAGFRGIQIDPMPNMDRRTSWGQHLTLGSNRKVLLIKGKKPANKNRD